MAEIEKTSPSQTINEQVCIEEKAALKKRIERSFRNH
jgi:hypothetical protein